MAVLQDNVKCSVALSHVHGTNHHHPNEVCRSHLYVLFVGRQHSRPHKAIRHLGGQWGKSKYKVFFPIFSYFASKTGENFDNTFPTAQLLVM